MITRNNLYIYKKIILEINYLEDQYLGDQYLDLQRQVINLTLELIANDQFFT